MNRLVLTQAHGSVMNCDSVRGKSGKRRFYISIERSERQLSAFLYANPDDSCELLIGCNFALHFNNLD